MNTTSHRLKAKSSEKARKSPLPAVQTPGPTTCRRSLRSTLSSQAPAIEHRKITLTSNAPASSLPLVSMKKRRDDVAKKRLYFKKVDYDGGVFRVGDDVYVKRREDGESDDDDPEEEECRICFETGKSLMIECDDCLGGFHLRCLRPPLRSVPEGDWICKFCDARKSGKKVSLPNLPEGKKLKRTSREKLLSGDLWAARIERLWKEPNGIYWLKCRWYTIPEETRAGRQPHNLRRELFITNHLSDIEMESVIRHCYIMSPKEFAEANEEGDDVFYCEYEYDVHWHSFKRLAEIAEVANIDNNEEAGNDEDWKYSNDSVCVSEDDSDFDDSRKHFSEGTPTHELAANSRKGRIFGLQKMGLKKIPERARLHKPSCLEKVKSMLINANLPKTLPCRAKEMEEITSFIKGAICEDQCFGRCLYIHGVPGTGKTMTVLAVLKNLKAEVESGKMRPYSFVEVNGLKLASPEYIYRVIYEALSGHRVGWKKALSILNNRFSLGINIGKQENQPCVLLVDELDLLLTRNQSVLYNVFDWPSKPNSNLIVIGIANTMDLPEKFLPRISSRLGIQRLCFGPYNHHQLQEIILSRLKGTDAFEDQAIEFASRKVAAISGDARRALEICRRAAEAADHRLKKQSSDSGSLPEGKHIVGINDIEVAVQEIFQSPHIQIMRTCSKLSKIMLTAMVHELYRSGLGEVTFERLATTIRSLCSNNRELLPGWDDLLKVGYKLSECRVILFEEGAKSKLQRLQLNFPSDDVAFALKNCSEIPWLSKYL